MRKYPRLTFGEWSQLNRAERASYVELARAETAMLRAEKERLRNTPRPIKDFRDWTHKRAVVLRQYNSLTGSSFYSETFNSTASVMRRREGTTNPRWRELVKSGQSATTPYSCAYADVKDTHGEVTVWHMQSGVKRVSSLSGPFAASTPNYFYGVNPSLSSADQSARIDFYKRLKSAQQRFGGGVFLGELRETIRLLRQPYQLIPDLIREHAARSKSILRRREKWLTERQRKSLISKSWLTTSFGILPLVSDIQSGAEAFASLLDHPRTKRVVGSGGDYARNSRTVTNTYNPYGGCMLWIDNHESWRYDLQVKYVGAVKLRASGTDPQGLIDLSRKFGVNASEFVPTLYEIMPWSFMIDYFTSLGDVINAWATVYSDVAWQVKNVRHLVTHEVTSQLNVPLTKQYTAGFLGHAEAFSTSKSQTVTLTRSDPGQVPLPDLRFSLNLSPMKVINLASLRFAMADEYARFKRWLG